MVFHSLLSSRSDSGRALVHRGEIIPADVMISPEHLVTTLPPGRARPSLMTVEQVLVDGYGSS